MCLTVSPFADAYSITRLSFLFSIKQSLILLIPIPPYFYLSHIFQQTILCILRSVLPTTRNRNIYRRERSSICYKRMYRGLLHGHSIFRQNHHQFPHKINEIRIHIRHLRFTLSLHTHSLFDRRLRHSHSVHSAHSRTPRDVIRRPAPRLLLLRDFARDWRRPQQISLFVEHRRHRVVQLHLHGRRNPPQQLGDQR